MIKYLFLLLSLLPLFFTIPNIDAEVQTGGGVQFVCSVENNTFDELTVYDFIELCEFEGGIVEESTAGLGSSSPSSSVPFLINSGDRMNVPLKPLQITSTFFESDIVIIIMVGVFGTFAVYFLRLYRNSPVNQKQRYIKKIMNR